MYTGSLYATTLSRFSARLKKERGRDSLRVRPVDWHHDGDGDAEKARLENAGLENAALTGYGKLIHNLKSTQRRNAMQ